jgi:hypothetical protein
MDRFCRLSKNMLLTTAALAVMAVSAAQARADGHNPDLHYLAVGVSKVPALPQQNQLRFAHKDALDLAKTWKAQAGGLYRKVFGESLTNEGATRSEILAALDRLAERAHKGDTVIVSLSGHGGLTPIRRSAEWYFVTHDFDPARSDETKLSEAVLRERLTKLTQRGVTVILVLDTCFSGAFYVGESGVVVFAACSGSQLSFEDGFLQNGLFTRAMIEALGGKADTNGDGVVTLAELEQYVTTRVAQMHAEQPVFDPDGRRLEQSPALARPIGVTSDLALVNTTSAGPVPVAEGRDRFRPAATER